MIIALSLFCPGSDVCRERYRAAFIHDKRLAGSCGHSASLWALMPQFDCQSCGIFYHCAFYCLTSIYEFN